MDKLMVYTQGQIKNYRIIYMDGWMDSCVGRWMDVWFGGWTDGQIR